MSEMDDGGTLDFDDLMDTGDEFPGFEIAKFTPANQDDGNDDGVLRTPEHEKDDEDYVISENKSNAPALDERMYEDDNSADVSKDADVSEIVGDQSNIDTMSEVDTSLAMVGSSLEIFYS